MKPGYKQTEIGEIPEDWEVGSLKEAFPRLAAGVSVNSDETVFSDFFILKTSAVRNGTVNVKESKHVVHSDIHRLKCPVKKGSIIISRMNTPAMVGECGYSNIDAPNTFLPDRLWQAEPLSSEYDYKWLNFLLNTERYRGAILATATGTSNSMKNISKERLLEIPFPKPPLPEQRRIAEALSDIDKLIESLEKLVIKKMAIKQGAMQELLTGKRRLPGFGGKWIDASINDIAELPTFTVQAKTIEIKDYVGTDNMISNKGGVRDNENVFPYTVVREFQSGDILLSNIRPYLKKIWLADRKGGCSNDVIVIRTKNKKKCVPAFLYYSLCQDRFFDEVMSNAVGTKMPRGDKAVILNYHILIPKEENEQAAIVNTLRDFDISIDRIESRLSKSYQIKHGMMQQLLTGMVRLI